MTGDLWMYWHIRGKNLSSREYATAFLELDPEGAPSIGRAGALMTLGLGSWISGQLERSTEEWGEAYRIAAELGAGREWCLPGSPRPSPCSGPTSVRGSRWRRKARSEPMRSDSPGPGARADRHRYARRWQAISMRRRASSSDALAIQERLGHKDAGCHRQWTVRMFEESSGNAGSRAAHRPAFRTRRCSRCHRAERG